MSFGVWRRKLNKVEEPEAELGGLEANILDVQICSLLSFAEPRFLGTCAVLFMLCLCQRAFPSNTLF